MTLALNNRNMLVGQRFGRLLVVEYSHTNKHNSRCYVCRCDCGTLKTINGNDLRSGYTRSCGCLQRERASEANSGEGNYHYTHGGTGSKLHRLWHGIYERCNSPKHISYPHYGARGITVCKEWADFATFRGWALANGYCEGLSIDRKDASKNYCPDNCEWITRSENTARGNRTRHKRSEINE